MEYGQERPTCPGCDGDALLATWINRNRRGWECLDACCSTRWAIDEDDGEEIALWNASATEQGISTLLPRV